MSDPEKQQILEQLNLDSDGLYQEENFTDRRVGSIQRLTPVTQDGQPDSSRSVLFVGSTQVMTPAGALPLNFELEVATLEEALAAFPEAAHTALEQTMEQLKEMQREQASRIMTPDQMGGGGLPGGGGGAPGGGVPGGGIQLR